MPHGKRITTLFELREAVEERRSVVCVGVRGASQPCLPAAVIINWSGSDLLRIFASGMYIYEKETKEVAT